MAAEAPAIMQTTHNTMTQIIQKNGRTYHQCEECKLMYAKKAIAEQCQAWCREHKSCNIEITKHAVDSSLGGELPNKKDRHELQREEKLRAQESASRKRLLKKIVSWSLGSIAAIGTVAALGWYVSAQPNLPPTNMQGHIEESPKAHILDVPMPDNIQRHMLEHADGKGKPGILIQYNCEKYFCEPDLANKLADLVKQYPDNVYLAPSNYDGKIILTKMGSLKILDSFDEQAIKSFIGQN